MFRPFRASTLCLAVAGFCLWTTVAAAQNALPEVELETSEGTIIIELNPEKAPKTVANFLEYVNSGFYEGTVFHRVIKDFMIQGGGHDKDLVEKPTRAPVVNEAGNGLSNKEYTIAMARTMDPDSATSQFFISTADNTSNLDRNRNSAGYTVFGRVVKGLDVVDRIESVETSAKAAPRQGLMQDVPVVPVLIKKASVRAKE
jgi:peptidyl-prolyl cis-trans isomerase A (cyclophilin A)